MGAETAGEQAVTVGDVGDVSRPTPGRSNGPGHQTGPVLEVPHGVADHGRPPGGPAQGMDADDLPPGHGEEPERIIRPQVLFFGERKLGDVVWHVHIAGVEAEGVEARAVVGDVVAGVTQSPAQAFGL